MLRHAGLLLICGTLCLGCSPPEGDVERPTTRPGTNETTPAPSLNETVPPSAPATPAEEPAEPPTEPMNPEPMETMPAPMEEDTALPPSVEPAEPTETAETPEPAETPSEQPMPPAEGEATATDVDVESAVQPTPAESVEGLLDEESKPEPTEDSAEEAADEPMSDAVEPVEPLESPQTSQPAEQAQMEKQGKASEKAPASGPVATKLTPDNTLIQFVGTHVGDKPDPRTGKFTKFQGEAKAAGGKLDSITVEIETGSLETEIEKLTNHLKSPDFFDTRQHPKASFKSTKIEAGDADTVTITGDLTLLGETKSITFPAKVTIEDDVHLTAEFDIDRTQFGMNYGTDNVHKNVNMTVKVAQ